MPVNHVSLVNRTPFELTHVARRNGDSVEITITLTKNERGRLRQYLKPHGIEVDQCAHGIFLDRTCVRCATEKDPTFKKMLRGEL